MTAQIYFDVPESLRKPQVSKFLKMFMIWPAICSCEKRSKPCVTTETRIDQVYMKEYLRKRMLPLLKSHNVPTMFWSDLGSSHYSKDVLKWYQMNRVNFVPKDHNPINTPE